MILIDRKNTHQDTASSFATEGSASSFFEKYMTVQKLWKSYFKQLSQQKQQKQDPQEFRNERQGRQNRFQAPTEGEDQIPPDPSLSQVMQENYSTDLEDSEPQQMNPLHDDLVATGSNCETMVQRNESVALNDSCARK